MTFGEFFRQRRIALGYTLRSFCKTFQLDPGNVSRLERDIIPPSVDEEKLAGYAIALQIKKETPEWVTFFDLAHTAKGRIPKDLLDEKDYYKMFPFIYKTVRGEKLGKEKMVQLINLVNFGNDTNISYNKTMTPLQQELKTFENKKSELLSRSKGKFVLIKKEKVIGIFETEEDAINQGYVKFKNTPFLVKQILETDPNYNFLSNLINV